MKGLIINNAYNTSATYLNQAQRLKEEFAALGVETDIRRNDFFPAVIEAGKLALTVSGYDFCVYLDKDKYVSKMLEKAGLRVFNRSKAIEICDDKMETHIALCDRGIPMPKTVSGLLCYMPNATVQKETVDRVENLIGYPVIIKESYGSLGKGVYKADTREELEKKMEELKMIPHLFQEFIAESAGMDIRVIVIGGKTTACMMRKSETDFRSNAELGGQAYNYRLSEEISKLCEKTSRILGLDYCGIDVLLGKGGKPFLCEVNSNAFWGKIEKVTGVNIARSYALHVIESINSK